MESPVFRSFELVSFRSNVLISFCLSGLIRRRCGLDDFRNQRFRENFSNSCFVSIFLDFERCVSVFLSQSEKLNCGLSNLMCNKNSKSKS